jgi:GGDEF domain-containing protein
LKAVLAARAPAQDEEPPASQEAGPAELPRSAAPPQPPPAPEEPRGRDPLTGLLLRRDAVDAISVYDGNRTHLYAAVVVMDGYQAFNRCHGPAAGDRAFSVLCRQLQNEFRPADRLFRWTPETVVALLVRPEPAVEVRSAVMGIAMKRHETTVQIGSRSVHIPIKCLAIAITSASPDPGDLVAKIDDFTAKRLRPHRA